MESPASLPSSPPRSPRWFSALVVLFLAGNFVWLNLLPASYSACMFSTKYRYESRHGIPYTYMIHDADVAGANISLVHGLWPFDNATPLREFRSAWLALNCLIAIASSLIAAIGTVAVARSPLYRRLIYVIVSVVFTMWIAFAIALYRAWPDQDSLSALLFPFSIFVLLPAVVVCAASIAVCVYQISRCAFGDFLVPASQYPRWFVEVALATTVLTAIMFYFPLSHWSWEASVSLGVGLLALLSLAALTRLVLRQSTGRCRSVKLSFRLYGVSTHVLIATIGVGIASAILVTTHGDETEIHGHVPIPVEGRWGWPAIYLTQHGYLGRIHDEWQTIVTTQEVSMLGLLVDSSWSVVLVWGTWQSLQRLASYQWRGLRFSIRTVLFAATLVAVMLSIALPGPRPGRWDFDFPDAVFLAATYFGLACAVLWVFDGLPRWIKFTQRTIVPPRTSD